MLCTIQKHIILPVGNGAVVEGGVLVVVGFPVGVTAWVVDEDPPRENVDVSTPNVPFRDWKVVVVVKSALSVPQKARLSVTPD